MTSAPPRLELAGLSKSFGTVRALRDVGLTVGPGEIHGLVGQNGSGKSTLIKILAGYHPPDRGGRILVDGRDLATPIRLRDLRTAGIAIVHQDFGLVQDKSVAENIAVGSFITTRWTRRVDWRAEARRAAEILDRLDVTWIDPARPVGALGPADRSIVAIARALRAQRPGEGLIVLDESTRALPKDGLEDFYRVLRSVVGQGGAALMVSHNLEEIREVTDRVTVLRDGAVVDGTLETAATSEQDIARRMLGRVVEQRVHTRDQAPGPAAPIAVRGLTGRAVDEVTMDIRPGEVLGLTGVAGAGWDEVPYLLTGARRPSRGSVTIGAATLDLARARSADCIAAGIALLPEHRIDDGLALTMPVGENITLPRVRRQGRPWTIGRGWQRSEIEAVLESLDVRPRRAEMPVGQLSGGNQQKVMLGKWLAGSPELLVLHEPTQAVDVGAREDILRAISEAARRGVAVVVASIQPSDLAAVCDRVLIFREGRVDGEITAPTENAVVEAVYADTSPSAHPDPHPDPRPDPHGKADPCPR
ncbi:sugar ABC transporter ATP-binding protein [Sphaerisporangium krabiense]|uniref:Ribose transport system ATP-binding protein n=1 Tax=Sphaerisporangium krabiense TaxID=763782 RepID=A0A7W8ZCJ3_9ACTN|nr:sugar ABC transporter ATP-binding protein [Sphaerisporangium krabiense]MBB5631548.1 ribose transport system ATP-binding protein [Sphaerisporangium krabiense]